MSHALAWNLPTDGGIMVFMTDVTQILSRIEQGDPKAAEQLLPVVYDELRKLAAARLASERPDHTLQATALVHEAYLRLVAGSNAQDWNGRGHFFAAAAAAMRRILIENARRRRRLKHGGGQGKADVDLVDLRCTMRDDDLIALDEALEELKRDDPTNARLIELRFFAGLTNEQAAEALGISGATAKRHWRYARAVLRSSIWPE